MSADDFKDIRELKRLVEDQRRRMKSGLDETAARCKTANSFEFGVEKERKRVRDKKQSHQITDGRR